MFNLRTAVVLSFVLGSFAAAARAATPIEFEFGGVLTEEAGTVHQAGDRFTTTVRFDPDTVDLDPSPLFGSYRYLSWTVPGPFASPFVFENNPPGRISVNLNEPFDRWRLDFFGAGSFNYVIRLEFPPGTFPNDQLPQNLPLSQAFTREFGGSDTNFILRGTIDSLTVRVVPDPTSAAILLPLMLLGARRHR